MDSQLEREEKSIEDDYAAGHITTAEYNRQLRELHRDYQACAEEAAEEAYRYEMDRW